MFQHVFSCCQVTERNRCANPWTSPPMNHRKVDGCPENVRDLIPIRPPISSLYRSRFNNYTLIKVQRQFFCLEQRKKKSHIKQKMKKRLKNKKKIERMKWRHIREQQLICKHLNGTELDVLKIYIYNRFMIITRLI